MRQHRYLIAAALAVPLVLAGSTLAQGQAPSPNPEASIVLKDSKAAPGTVRLSKFIGSETIDPGGKDVGKIKDVVLSPSRDEITYVVMEQRKGLVGARDKLIALPYKAMKYGSPAEDRVYVLLSGDILDNAPGFDNSKWPLEANADYYRSLDNYYKTQLSTMDQKVTEEPKPAEAESQVAAAQIGEDTDLEWSRRATKLEDRGVISPMGENLGEIADIVADQKTGKIVYAGFKDDRGKLHAVPLSVFTQNEQEKKLVLDTTREQLKQMPSFDDDHWPAQADPRWTKEAKPQ